jgi:hypothetical protein
MKISTGRGIKFFKHPVFIIPKNFVVNTYKFSSKRISNIIRKGKNR